MSSIVSFLKACRFQIDRQQVDAVVNNKLNTSKDVKELVFNIPYIEYNKQNNKLHIGFIVRYLQVSGTEQGSYILLDYLSNPLKAKIITSELIPYNNDSLKFYANKCNISYEECVGRLFDSGFMLKHQYYNLLK